MQNEEFVEADCVDDVQPTETSSIAAADSKTLETGHIAEHRAVADLSEDGEDGGKSVDRGRGGDGRQREMGEQPLAACMLQHGLRPHHLVAASPDQLTHKMVNRAIRGRWLTKNTMKQVILAYNLATGEHKSRGELFNY